MKETWHNDYKIQYLNHFIRKLRCEEQKLSEEMQG